MPALIHRDAPGAVPADVRDLLARFGLTVRGLLTADRSSPKLSKGSAAARAVILHHLPARALAMAITPANDGPTPARAFIPALLELAERERLTAAARRHDGCPWATAGCGGVGGGCLVWSGHGGMGQTVPAARGRRTLAMLADPAAYARAVFWAVLSSLRAARRDGLPLAVRLRGTDDTPWHLQDVPISTAEAVSLRHRFGVDLTAGVATMAARLAEIPDVRPYEYSKAPLGGPLGLIAQRDAGVDLTASFAADRATATADGIAAIRAGFRLAVPVDVTRGAALPEALTLTSGRDSVTVRAIDGDRSDHRWMDPHGVAVMLRTKRSRGADPAVADLFSLAAHDRPQQLADGSARLIWPD
jgi:hypothetical protein